jgi:hypothetical protein
MKCASLDALQDVFVPNANKFTAKIVAFLGLQPNLDELIATSSFTCSFLNINSSIHNAFTCMWVTGKYLAYTAVCDNVISTITKRKQ